MVRRWARVPQYIGTVEVYCIELYCNHSCTYISYCHCQAYKIGMKSGQIISIILDCRQHPNVNVMQWSTGSATRNDIVYDFVTIRALDAVFATLNKSHRRRYRRRYRYVWRGLKCLHSYLTVTSSMFCLFYSMTWFCVRHVFCRWCFSSILANVPELSAFFLARFTPGSHWLSIIRSYCITKNS